MQSFDRDSFLKSAAQGVSFIPLAKSWPADLETPLTTWMKVGEGRPPGVLLESVEGGETLGRWSVIASNPLWIATARGDQLNRRWRDGEIDNHYGNPFDSLRSLLKPYKSIALHDLPKLGQIYGMWGYELINWIEPSVPVYSSKEKDTPDGIWMFMDSILIFDQVKRLITAVAYGDLTREKSAEKAYQNAVDKIQKLENYMSSPLKERSPLAWTANGKNAPETESNFSQIDFENAVMKAKGFVEKGDVFQLVLSQRLEAKICRQPIEIYRSLRMVNPSPFMAFFDFGDWQLIGSSPEVMVKAEPCDDGIRATLRPIAGTRPRGKNNQEDAQLEEDLLSDPKERAEHVMLVDLGRNDLGRVCLPGSINVRELMVIEKYSHVMHIVSEVEGLLKADADVWDLLMAAFPAGTVSGAPKIRAMQLIHQLEPHRRGPYSGVYGSLDLNGALNTAITIRTLLVSPGEDGEVKVQVQAGAGVVADSIPEKEFQETLNKARGMFVALACLGNQCS